MNKNDEEKTKMLRVDHKHFGDFEKLMIEFMIEHDRIISRKEFFGELISEAIKKGANKAPKNTLNN